MVKNLNLTLFLTLVVNEPVSFFLFVIELLTQ